MDKLNNNPMIELNNKTQQDFLNREWVQRLLDAGIDMSDAKYIIAKDKFSINDDEPDLTDYIWYKDSTEEVYDVCPTLSVSELLAILPKEVSITAGGEKSKHLIEALASLLIKLKTIKEE